MASSSKPTPRQNFTKAKSPHLLESSFDVIDRSASRPNSSLATPTYMSTVQYKSAHSSLKRTRSNSSIPTEGPKSINTGEKTASSPVNFQLSVHGVSPKEMSNLAATTSLQLDKGTSDDISMRNRNKNSTGNRMLSSNGWAGQKKFKGNHNLLEHSQSEFQRNKSPMHSRENKRSDSISKRGENVDQNKSQMKDLVLGYSKSVSYGIAESETPGSTQRTAGLTKRNKFQTPVFVIDCESDLKENKEGLQENMNRNNIETPHVQSPYTIMPLEKSNQNIQAKKTARGSSVKRSNQGLDEKKNEKRGKENELVDESQTRERGSKQQLSGRAPTNSFFNKKTDLRPPSRPSTTKASLSTRREEPSNFSEYSSRQLDTPTDLEASARILSKIRPQMLHAHSATATPKNYFVPKTTSSVSQSQRNSSPRSSKTPRSAFLQTQPANTEILSSIQPSKNSEFSFKMTYFKPIEDSKLDEFIRDVNDSYFPKKDPLNKTSEKNRNMTEPTEAAFSTPLPSTGVTSKARSRYSGENSKDEGLNITGEVILPDMKTHGSLKKTMTMDYKNSSNLMEKTMVQETHGKPPKPRSNNCTTNKVKEERQSTTECVPERAVSPSFEKKNMMSAEKPKVKDMNTKIESKARTTYSKLDKLLQEIKSNPGNKQHDEEGKPDSSELEKELFGQSSSKGISSSSSTNCSISKSYAHTLMKVTST